MSLKQFSLLIKYDHKIYLLRKLNNDLLINIEKLNLELLEYRNANRVIKENTHNILRRFLVDKLLNNFIKNIQIIWIKLKYIYTLFYNLFNQIIMKSYQIMK